VGVEAPVEEHQEDGAASADGAAAVEEGDGVVLAQAVEEGEEATRILQDHQEGFEGADHDNKEMALYGVGQICTAIPKPQTKLQTINENDFRRTRWPSNIGVP